MAHSRHSVLTTTSIALPSSTRMPRTWWRNVDTFTEMLRWSWATSVASAIPMRTSRSQNERPSTKIKQLSSRWTYRTPSTGMSLELWTEVLGTAALGPPRELALLARRGKSSSLYVTNSDVRAREAKILLLEIQSRRIFLVRGRCRMKFDLGVNLSVEHEYGKPLWPPCLCPHSCGSYLLGANAGPGWCHREVPTGIGCHAPGKPRSSGRRFCRCRQGSANLRGSIPESRSGSRRTRPPRRGDRGFSESLAIQT